jgi:hypothetical protein
VSAARQEAFLQSKPGTPVDRFGVWLSGLQIRRFVGSFAGKRVGDFGCGYQASFTLPSPPPTVTVSNHRSEAVTSGP